MTSDDDSTVAEGLGKRLNSISEIVEKYLTDDALEARLRRLKDSAGDRRGWPVGLRGRREVLDNLLALMRGSRRACSACWTGWCGQDDSGCGPD